MPDLVLGLVLGIQEDSARGITNAAFFPGACLGNIQHFQSSTHPDVDQGDQCQTRYKN